ncbi:hypothetical protein E1287_37735 [Actinomadura sp. KC06]|uniref:hypothetical protein n=1 Tax=Actinomadura sp. KC06 TaxID=2530369 RepID=UPI00104EF48A|nr:hypothetical protein [Actinomadura sp. KC06]TDD25005.1 hypothetical protein E1287_37735 [Actinomadura sp. KC06]
MTDQTPDPPGTLRRAFPLTTALAAALDLDDERLDAVLERAVATRRRRAAAARLANLARETTR